MDPTEREYAIGPHKQRCLTAGDGPPLLVLHDEMGHPGWLAWHERLAAKHELIVPLAPGFGLTPRVEWIACVRDLACYYARMLRDNGLAPINVIGFSFGAWLAAEMAVGDPALFTRMALVAPLGIRPHEGEILDAFALTHLDHLAATVNNPNATPEFSAIYGGEPSPEQVERFDDARAETARLAWQPYLHNPSLPHLLGALGDRAEVLLVHGEADRVAPPAISEAYKAALPGSRVVGIPNVGHRPEIEATDAFLDAVVPFLKA